MRVLAKWRDVEYIKDTRHWHTLPLERIMFIGTHYNAIDEKSRVIIPSKFRADFAGKCILTNGIERCLNIYTLKGWEAFISYKSDLPLEDDKIRSLIRLHYATAVECDVDRQGRLTIPPAAKQYASLEKELATTGVGSCVEIWDRESYTRKIEEDMRKAAELSNYAAELAMKMGKR
jgi:MraZ protein